jgi:hypothetical protein
MKINPTFRSAYPKLTRWIETNLPKVPSKKKVWAAFVKYSELKPGPASLALTPGQLPEVNFRVMNNADGEYEGAKFPDTIFLSKELCDRFESKDFNNAQMHDYAECTLLHEMVHWGDWKDGVDQVGEEGEQFEIAAYGKVIGRHW